MDGTDKKLQMSINRLLSVYENDPMLEHINKYNLPSKETIINIISDFKEIIFPGYFSKRTLTTININAYISDKVTNLYEMLVSEINKSIIHDSEAKADKCESCSVITDSMERAESIALKVIDNIPQLRDLINKDVKAAFSGDPAAKNYYEIIFSYPCITALVIHRIANFLYNNKVPYIPRIMSEYSHSVTGIDIHPGATLGEYFFIDHGTGVVVGETCVIGNNVKVYQGVTLGALSFPKDEGGNIIKGLRRHPTIEDNVTIYAGATILGGETVIGANSIIGGNVWITSKIAPNSRVTADLSGANIITEKNKFL